MNERTVIEVNEALAKEYSKLAKRNVANVRGINIDPNTSFNPGENVPKLAGVPTIDPKYRNRIIGEVNLANTKSTLSTVQGNRISLRADEGSPFNVGTIKSMKDNVIFHALEETQIKVGNNVTYGARAIVHGGGRQQLGGGASTEPTTIEDNVTLKDQAVVFRSLLGKGSTVGVKTAVISSEVSPSATIGDRIIYLNNVVFGTVEW